MVEMLHIQELMNTVFVWVERSGGMAPVYYILVYAVGALLFLPLALLSAPAGFLFGIVPGALMIDFAALLASGASYLISHYFLRGWVRAEIKKHRSLRVLDLVVKTGGWKVVMLSRIAPIFPFIPLNLAYGISEIGYWKFLIFSFIGFLPGAFLYAYIGSLAGSLIGLEERTPLPGENFFLAISIAAAILATVYMTKLTRQALASTPGTLKNH